MIRICMFMDVIQACNVNNRVFIIKNYIFDFS